MKSKWKGFFFKYQFFLNEKKNIKKISRNLRIYSSFLGKKVKIYNGKNYYIQEVKKDMIGLKFGDLVITKKITNKIHLKKK